MAILVRRKEGKETRQGVTPDAESIFLKLITEYYI